jgi:anti-sigma factor (TIGR02949 family)
MSDPNTIDCAEALRLLAEYLDGELRVGVHDGVEHHLHACRSCYSRAEFEQILRTQLKQVGREEVRPAFEERIRQLVVEFTPAPVSRPDNE